MAEQFDRFTTFGKCPGPVSIPTSCTVAITHGQLASCFVFLKAGEATLTQRIPYKSKIVSEWATADETALF